MKNDMDLLKKQLKENIQKLIDAGNLEEAKALVEQYENIAINDVEAYSINAVILIMESKLDEAESVLKHGLNIDEDNFDLNYNLGYLYNEKNEYELSLQFYKKAYISSDNDDMKVNIKELIRTILLKLDKNISIDELLNNLQKIKNNTQRYLILCHFYSVYTKEFIEKIHAHTNIKFDLLTMGNNYKKSVNHKAINNIYVYSNLNEMYEFLSSTEKYDIIHIHFLTPFYGEIDKQIRNKCNNLIITIWGTDFYRTNKQQKDQQRTLIEMSDNITFDNDVTLNEFVNYYGENNRNKSRINRFGLTVLEYIKNVKNVKNVEIKKEFRVPENSIVVTCGYNANCAHNHLKIIKSLKQVINKLPENMYYIFPMTYSRDEEYCRKVKGELAKSGLKYIVLENFMNFHQMAKLAKATDVMIQLQTTDTLSATMQENMYSGNIVVTGSWLPYKPLKQVGAFFLEVSSVNKIGKKLVDVVKNIESYKKKCNKNSEIIWNFSAWENVIIEWEKLYDLKEKNFLYKIPKEITKIT